MTDHDPHTEAEIVELVRSIDARAPAQLHARIEALVAASSPQGERASADRARRSPVLRWGLLAGAPAVAAAAIVVLVVSLAGGGGSPAGSSRLTLDAAVALTLQPATMGPPAEDPRQDTQLKVAQESVPFPYWEESFGFRATGERRDRVEGRKVTTVFYADAHNKWLGYAIVGGTPPPPVRGGQIVRRGGTVFRFLNSHGARVVTWLRDGRLCVVAGHGVSDQTLLRLASWHGVAA